MSRATPRHRSASLGHARSVRRLAASLFAWLVLIAPARAENQLALLQAANSVVNVIPYVLHGQDSGWMDQPIPGYEWQCRNYAVDKKRILIAWGFPADRLSLVLLWTEPAPLPEDSSGLLVPQWHAALAASIGDTVWVLDNRQPFIFRATEPPVPYIWAFQLFPGMKSWRDARGGLIPLYTSGQSRI